MKTYEIEMSDGRKVQFEWEGEGEPSYRIYQDVINSIKQPGTITQAPPKWVEPVLSSSKMLGLTGGAFLGSPGGPVGQAVGAGLGYSGMGNLAKGLMEVTGVIKPRSEYQALAEAFTDIPVGMATEMTGQMLPVAIGAIGKGFSYPWGAYTGSGNKAIQEAYRGRPGFAEFMRGQGSEAKLVGQAKSGLESLVEDRQLGYSDLLSKIKNPNLPQIAKPEVIKALQNAEQEFGLKFAQGGQIKFTNTRFVTNPMAQKEIRTAIKTVEEWKSWTPKGVDELKQALDNLYKRSQPEASTFITKLRGKVKDILVQNVPEYKQAMANYKTDTDLIKEISKDLSLGDMNTKKQALAKLLNAMKRDDDFTMSLISKLDERSGGQLIPSLAGMQMQSKIPTSLVGKMGGMYQIFQGITNLNPQEVVGLLASSPRITGEFLNVLGKFAPYFQKASRHAPAVIQSMQEEKLEGQ